MNKLALVSPAHPAEALSKPSTRFDSIDTSLELAPRLIVLIPANSDSANMTHRVWDLANTTGMPVQLLGLCKDEAEEPSLRRELITMSALIQDGRISTDVRVEIGTNWLDAVKRNYQMGDMIVCFAEQRAGLLQRPLSQILQTNLQAPVYILSGLYPQNPARWNWLYQIMAWSGSIGIIIGAAVLQIRITSLAQDWAQTTLLILSVIGEVWLIWGWNSLFS